MMHWASIPLRPRSGRSDTSESLRLDRAPPPDRVGPGWMTLPAHAVPRAPAMTALVEPLDTVTRNLDRLSGAFVSAILSLDQNDPGRVVEAMLQPIGEALAVDHEYRQRVVCARRAQPQPAARPSVRSRQLRGPAADAHRERALRPRTRRLHRCGRDPPRTFELAHTGTLFLDEIGDLPRDVQAKLLRVLQECEFERVGSSEPRRVDVRIVAATHHDLEAAMKDSRFRAGLYYRLGVFPIALPPLRERTDDIPRLAWLFVNRRQRALNRRFTSIPPGVLAVLQRHQWPGNVRELENVIERAMIHSTGSALLLDEGPGPSVWSVARDDTTLEQVELRHIESVLKRCRWRVNGPGNAAEILGLHPNTLHLALSDEEARRSASERARRRSGCRTPVGVTNRLRNKPATRSLK